MLDTLTLRLSTTLRSWARKTGIISLITKHQNSVCVGEDAYEQLFDNAMFREIKLGDIIWDVGANIGSYTQKFSEAVGSTGSVHAFEPSIACFSALKTTCAHLQNVYCHSIALGEKETILSMYMDKNVLGASHSFVNSARSQEGAVNEVSMTSGDYLITQEKMKCPHIIKIDVEGYEEEVLQGLKKTLVKPECRAIFCEIHFSMLCEKGQEHAPVRILKFLKATGFSIKWVDRSHIAAYKKTN